jgi:3-oxoacid CoA-transferase B subunit
MLSNEHTQEDKGGRPRLDEWAVACRAAREIREGMCVNLGVGIPITVGSFVAPDLEVLFHSENGLVGYGRIIQDPDRADLRWINAAGQPVERAPGMSAMAHHESFELVRGGFIDITFLGGLEVSAGGDLANHQLPGRPTGSMGGAPDLARCARTTIILMTHQTKSGAPKLVSELTLAPTARGCVDRVITDIAVIDRTAEGFVLREALPGWTPEDIAEVTGAPLQIPDEVAELSL